jgi:putative transposase
MDLARSTYYDAPCGQPLAEARLVARITAICAQWPRYGYRRVTAQLRHEGLVVNHKKVMRLMKDNGLRHRQVVWLAHGMGIEPHIPICDE